MVPIVCYNLERSSNKDLNHQLFGPIVEDLMVLQVSWKDMVVVLPIYTFCGNDIMQHGFVGKGVNRLGHKC